ncbi:biotin/lipoyl-containing protein [Megasphaera sp. UPII 135-E]|uniref:biotin/lipoyl-containing protein n=1 Tax=Megasphaera sp. UPII 135-E TaxID=1000569 RepID=UPI00021A36B5|nr:biotin/lipoyl-containing protein [Megasphaera sp. UPII 135-E]EGS34692.1 glutaconyl-CoA decarboxylase subunit gamma [Megasphaera sp. UPII 135-E]
MKKFKVTVNGQVYEVEVEEVGAVETAAPVVSKPVVTPAATPVVTPPKEAAATAPPKPEVHAPTPEGAVTIKAPMPGKISAVKVDVDQTVTRGDVVVVLEAMKMQNDITTNQDGKIVQLRVQVGDSVKTGDILAVLQ